jgi:NAD(P)-dependent dehydrogenase (short-subunit alcohol dehydrogenase family)
MGAAGLRGKIVVVTGAARGLGLGMARRFAQAGAHPVLADIEAAGAKNAAAALTAEGLAASYDALDVRVPSQSVALVDRAVKRHGRIDVWVNNAGIARIDAAEAMSPHDWDESLAVMLSGVFYCSQAAGRQMLAQGGGVIINIASVDGFKAIEGRAAYCTAKAGVIMLTQVLGIEWAGRGVRVVGLAPGVVLTELVKQVIANGWASSTLYETRTPLRRLGTVEDIAEAAVFLAGDEASYITAETLRVDGGWVAYQLF